MPSIISSLSYQYKVLTNAKDDLKKQLSARNHGTPKDMTPPKYLEKRHQTQAAAISGRPVYYIDFEKAEEKPCILYFHGGAFLSGLSGKHWQFVKKLLFGSGCPIVVPDYPLIPEHTCKRILPFCIETYMTLTPKCPHGIILIGDSAGANLALTVAQYAVRKGAPKGAYRNAGPFGQADFVRQGIHTPNQILLLSPCLDLSGDNPIKNVLAHRDPVLELESCREAALLYAGSRPLNDPLISPVFGSMKGLPRVCVWTGDNSILYADSLLLKEALKKAHTPYHIYTYPHMIHNWMFEGIPEGRKALRQVILTVREYL